MTKFLSGVLSVIAVGVMLIAYGLLSGRAEDRDASLAFDPSSPSRPMLVNERVMLNQDPYAYARDPYAGNPYLLRPASPYAYPAGYGYNSTAFAPARPVESVETVETVPRVTSAPRRLVQTREVQRAPKRDWKKTAIVIGGTSAAGAGVGAIFGGKKGALIGAAIGGGASALYEANKH